MIEKNTCRNLLLELGVGDFNATMAIPYMFIAPRALDPAMPQMLVTIKQLQGALAAMGASGIMQNGVLDPATSDALAQLVGPEWLAMPFYEIVKAVVNAERSGFQYADPNPPGGATATPTATDGILDTIPNALGLPSVPGGILTYGLGAYLIFSMLKKRK